MQLANASSLRSISGGGDTSSKKSDGVTMWPPCTPTRVNSCSAAMACRPGRNTSADTRLTCRASLCSKGKQRSNDVTPAADVTEHQQRVESIPRMSPCACF